MIIGRANRFLGKQTGNKKVCDDVCFCRCESSLLFSSGEGIPDSLTPRCFCF